jgi:hypothetical protein
MWTICAPRGNEVVERTVAGVPDQIARGEMLAASICWPMQLDQSWPPNLTPAGRIDEWTDGQIQRAIREGTHPNGPRMPVMYVQTFRNFSQEDLDSIVAYLRSMPATPNDLGKPKTHLSTLAMAMTTLGMLPLKDQPESNVPQPAVPIAPTAEYGEYITKFTDGVVCHGENYTGGTSAILPHGPNLRIVKNWTAAQFINTMRT